MKRVEWKQVYPMDFYSYQGGEWSVYHKVHKEREEKRKKRKEEREAKKKAKAQV